jgi:hypothetical protein
MEKYWPGHIMNNVVENLFGSKICLWEGKEIPTTRGIHMGQGPSWVILSLINVSVALSAGAPRGSFAVCGDDLVGFWDEPTIQRYTDTLEMLGMPVNRSKSFKGQRGVFCEMMMRTKASLNSDHKDVKITNVAKSTMPVYLSEKYSARFRAGLQDSFLWALEGSKKESVIRRKYPKLPNLPPSCGGGGMRKASRRDYKNLLKKGRTIISSTHVPGDRATELRKMNKKSPMDKINDPRPPMDRYEPILKWLMREERIQQAFAGSLKVTRKLIDGAVTKPSTSKWKRYCLAKGKSPLTKQQRYLIHHAPWKVPRYLQRIAIPGWSKVGPFLDKLPKLINNLGETIDSTKYIKYPDRRLGNLKVDDY